MSTDLAAYVGEHRESLAQLAAELVRIPSENRPPVGAERACQEWIAARLDGLGWEVDLYGLDEVPGLNQHPLFWPGRDYTGRPNVGARRRGAGGGRSLLLSGHIDTVPRGEAAWTHDPFGAGSTDGRLYGRGALDMKAGVATALFVAEALDRLNLRLDGDLLIESVVDEEFGGVNGTLAGRLRGFNADAAIIGEPTGLRICPAQRGGRLAHLTFRAPGDIFGDEQAPGAIDQVRCFLDELPRFAEVRQRRAPIHPLYAHLRERAPVSVTRISTASWGTSEPIAVPLSCRFELYWQAVPGETQQDVENDFTEWFDALITAHPRLFAVRPELVYPIRWLPGSALAPEEPLVAELAACAHEALDCPPPIQGIEAPCDMFVFHQAFGTPAVLWGARGANAHAPDEYVELDSLAAAAEVLLRFVCQWCGVAS